MAKSKDNQPKVRSWVAVAAKMRNSAGSMGHTKRKNARNKRERQTNKQDIRKEWS